MFCYSAGRKKLEGFINVVVKPRRRKLKENKSDYEIDGQAYRNYVLKCERKRPFARPALRQD
jgi:hypothetical protein